jgi:hypothetical protein
MSNISPTSRRRFLQRAACGIGYTALAASLHEQAVAAGNPLRPRVGHLPARAKRVIFMFMQGGPSQMETFDHKPRLNAEHGQPSPFEREQKIEQPGVAAMRLFGSGWEFRQHGQSGIQVSELFPHMAGVIDDICVLNGMHTDNLAHAPACLQLHTGFTNLVQPSMGAWTVYGLGTENRNLPGFITISHPVSGDGGSPQHFSSAYLPAIYQGTNLELPRTDGAAARLRNLEDASFPADLQRTQLDFVRRMNRRHLAASEQDARMEGMIQSFELAFRMQTEAPELFRFEGESDATKKLYGIGEKTTDWFGRQCLLARRFAEAGVRFIQVNAGGWDHHGQIRKKLPENAAEVDKPVAGLIADLKARGMLDETLIVWTGEFGRTPYEQDLSEGKGNLNSYGRGHNPFGFTTLLAGGGVKGGLAYGATDDYGYRAVSGKVHLHDLHATILHQLGLDHERLTYRHAGRDFRLTDVYGEVVKEILT